MTLLEEIQNGETETLEFKREIPSKDSKLMKTVVAFSNCHGGRILFGVDDETHEIVGIENENVFKYMDSLADMISESVEPQVIPRITFETIEDKTVVVVQIVAGQNQPYFLKSEGMNDGVYIRVAATTRKAEREKVKELMLLGEVEYSSDDESFTAIIRRTRKDLFDMNVPKTITEMSLNVPKKSVELHQNFTRTSPKIFRILY